MKTPDEIQGEYEIRLALRQAEARGVIDADVCRKLLLRWQPDQYEQAKIDRIMRFNGFPSHQGQ